MGGFIIYVGFRVIKLFNDVSVQLHENIADVLKGLRVYYLYIQSSNQCEVSHEMAAELAHAIATEVNQCFGGEAILRLTSSDIIKGMSTAFSTGHSALGTRKAIAEAGEATLHLNRLLRWRLACKGSIQLSSSVPMSRPWEIWVNWMFCTLMQTLANFGKHCSHCGLATRCILCLKKSGTMSYPST